MISVIILCAFSLISSGSFADSEIYKRWQYSKLIKKETASKQKNQFKVLRRFSMGAGKPLIASSVFSYSPTSPKTSVDEVILLIKKSFKGKKWSEGKINGAYILSTYLGRGNRTIRIYLKKTKDGFYSYSSFIRPGYLKSVIKEIEFMESTFSSYVETLTSKAKYTLNWKAFINILIPNAFAALGNLSIDDFIGSASPESPSVTAPSSVGGPGIPTTASNTTPSTVDRLSNAINATPEDIQNLNELKGEITDNTNKITKTIDGSVSTLTNKKEMAKLAAVMGFSGAVGAAMGGLFVNLVINSVSGISDYIWELVSSEKEDAEKFKNFNTALLKWEELNDEVGKLEKILDQFLKSFEKYKGMNVENILSESREETQRYYFLAMLEKQKYEDPRLSEGCRFQAFKNHRDFLKWGESIDSIVKYSQGNNIRDFKKYNGYFCSILEELKRKLINAELGLSQLRIALLNGEKEYFVHNEKQLLENAKEIEYFNSAKNKKNIKSAVDDYVTTIEKISNKQNEEKSGTWVRKCGRSKTGIGGHFDKQIAKSHFSNFVTKEQIKERLCKNAYSIMGSFYDKKKKMPLKKLLAQARRDAKDAFSQSKKRQLSINIDSYAKNALVMKNWFRKLEFEAYCNNILREKKETLKDYYVCYKKNKALASLDSSLGDAQRTYQSKCDEKFGKYMSEVISARDGENEELDVFSKALKMNKPVTFMSLQMTQEQYEELEFEENDSDDIWGRGELD